MGKPSAFEVNGHRHHRYLHSNDLLPEKTLFVKGFAMAPVILCDCRAKAGEFSAMIFP